MQTQNNGEIMDNAPETFAFNGEEFALPDSDSGFKLIIRSENTANHWSEAEFNFSSAADRDAVRNAIIGLLSGKNDSAK